MAQHCCICTTQHYQHVPLASQAAHLEVLHRMLRCVDILPTTQLSSERVLWGGGLTDDFTTAFKYTPGIRYRGTHHSVEYEGFVPPQF